MAIRAALGAGRRRIVSQLLSENGLLFFFGGGLGLVLGYVGVQMLLAINPGNIPRIGERGSALMDKGASIWLDQLDIEGGQLWDKAVQDALSNCQRVLVILSPAAVESKSVMDELSFALEENKTVIPLLYRDCALPFRVRRLQRIDFRENYERASARSAPGQPEPRASNRDLDPSYIAGSSGFGDPSQSNRLRYNRLAQTRVRGFPPPRKRQ